LHIAIDDTYGPLGATPSEYVTGDRRTHVAVVFEDREVEHIRAQIRGALMRIAAELPSAPSEFHFTDLYNRRGAWKNLPAGKNLNLLEVFAKLYRHYRWRVFVQTVDDYTLRDHPELGDLPGFGELAPKENRADLSLLLLCLQIRIVYKATRPAIQLFVDQGLRRPQKSFGEKLFSDWTGGYFGKFESSATEPLLQIADFVAFCINRSTYLAMKQPRSKVDHQFLEMLNFMQINCDQLKPWVMKRDFTSAEFDEAMRKDRAEKGLE
jgi:hypothetical protein